LKSASEKALQTLIHTSLGRILQQAETYTHTIKRTTHCHESYEGDIVPALSFIRLRIRRLKEDVFGLKNIF
jgi:hypothetical protein